MAFGITLNPPSAPVQPQRPAPPRPSTQPAPADQYAGPRAQTAADPRVQLREQQERAGLITGMLVDPKGTEAAGLHASLGRVDTDVLRFASSNGLKVGVVRTGDDFDKLGVLQPRTAEQVAARLPEMQADAARYRAATGPVDAEIAKVRAQLDALGPAAAPAPYGGFGGLGGFGCTPPEPTALQKQGQTLSARLGTLDRQRTEALSGAMGRGQDPAAIPVSVPMPTPTMDIGAGMAAQVNRQLTEMPRSPADMARMAGARTPEQIKEYTGLLEGINGERLATARADMQATLDKLPPEQRLLARPQLDAIAKDPAATPLDFKKHDLYVPNLFFTEDGQRLNLHDTQTRLDWGAKARPLVSDKNPEGSGLQGQYFQETKRVLVRSEQATPGAAGGHGDTPVHELAHGIDHLVRERDPKFYEGWSGRLKTAHEAASGSFGATGDKYTPGKGSVSGYALTNPGEYIAEGVAHYYDDPKLLKSKDPVLYGLTEELLARAKALGRP